MVRPTARQTGESHIDHEERIQTKLPTEDYDRTADSSGTVENTRAIRRPKCQNTHKRDTQSQSSAYEYDSKPQPSAYVHDIEPQSLSSQTVEPESEYEEPLEPQVEELLRIQPSKSSYGCRNMAENDSTRLRHQQSTYESSASNYDRAHSSSFDYEAPRRRYDRPRHGTFVSDSFRDRYDRPECESSEGRYSSPRYEGSRRERSLYDSSREDHRQDDIEIKPNEVEEPTGSSEPLPRAMRLLEAPP
ncbi:hypothetical protein MMC09_004363 [Bachmanniomyces sp. S44760]|nr:hypothetical protein [Bachmanniomyces sp. S44760]